MKRKTLLALSAAAVPLLLGVIATTVLVTSGEHRILTGSIDFAWLWLLLGGVLTLLGVAVVVFMTSAQRRADAALLRGQNEQQEDHRRFLSRLDHELKNPLTAIRVSLANIDAESMADATQSIDTQTQRLSRLLGDLRKLSEVQSMPLERVPVDIAEVAAEAVEIAQELPEARDREFDLSFPRAPRPLPAVAGDPDLLFLAVYNLAANAVKYSDPGDRIELRGSEDEGTVVLEVADTGRGIPDDEHDSVWEELARGTHTRDVSGSGLGLPFVRAIIERHGGQIALRSRLGEGTVVKVRLPAHARI